MKTWPPRVPRTQPITRRRMALFHPVPVAPRADGWTARRQGDFIGHLAETRSVLEACRRVGMGRESAYRLRKRAGAAGFAAAWDAALGKPHTRVAYASGKATGQPPHERWRGGLVRVIMGNGRFVTTVRKDDDNALLQHLAHLDRGERGT